MYPISTRPYRRRAATSLSMLMLMCMPLGLRADATVAEKLKPWREVLRDHHFSGVVSVRQGVTSVFEYADNGSQAEHRQINSNDIFWIASVSKQFASAAVLRLVSQGKVELDAPVSRYLPLTQGALSMAGQECTLEHILSHTCGLPAGSSVCNDVDIAVQSTQAAYLKCVGALALDFTPGSKHQYANLGFGLAGLIVENVAKTSYEKFLQREFFVPLGMQATGVDLAARPSLVERLAPGELFLQTFSLDASSWLMLDRLAPGRRGASGNVYSNAEDLHRWNQALHTQKILAPDLYQSFIRERLDNYGLGIATKRSQNTVWYWHNGGLTPMGYSSYLAYEPTYDLSVVVLTNRGPKLSYMNQVGKGLILTAVEDRPAALEAIADEDYAYDVLFAIFPPLLGLTLVLQLFVLLRGPRKAVASWCTGLLGTAAAAILIVGIVDFYHEHSWFFAAELAVLFIAVVAHRKKWLGKLMDSTAFKAEKRSAIVAGFVVAVLVYTMRGDDLLWLLASLCCIVLPMAALLFLARRRRHAMQRPKRHAETNP